MYSSAEACTRAAWSEISQPPPSVMPNGAATTGFGRVLDRHVGLLEAVDGDVQLVPLAFLGGQQHQHEVGADAESSRPGWR